MSRRVALVVLYEDQQHWAFAHRLLEKQGWDGRKLAPVACDSFGQIVKRFPQELRAYRVRAAKTDCRLVVMMDEDTEGRNQRSDLLTAECRAVGVDPPLPQDRVALIFPARNIETWLAYLEGEEVDETRVYPKLTREKQCREHVRTLHEMCQRGQLREPAPPSLAQACHTYHNVLRL